MFESPLMPKKTVTLWISRGNLMEMTCAKLSPESVTRWMFGSKMLDPRVTMLVSMLKDLEDGLMIG